MPRKRPGSTLEILPGWAGRAGCTDQKGNADVVKLSMREARSAMADQAIALANENRQAPFRVRCEAASMRGLHCAVGGSGKQQGVAVAVEGCCVRSPALPSRRQCSSPRAPASARRAVRFARHHRASPGAHAAAMPGNAIPRGGPGFLRPGQPSWPFLPDQARGAKWRPKGCHCHRPSQTSADPARSNSVGVLRCLRGECPERYSGRR